MLVLELKVGNAKVKVCDDYYRDISQAEMDARKKHLREVIGRIAITPGAAERLAAFREQDAKRDGSNVQVTWHIPVSGVGAQLDLEGELTTDIKVDTNLIPESVRDDLAATTLDAVREYFQQPGVQEKFEKWQASRKPNNRLNDHPENS